MPANINANSSEHVGTGPNLFGQWLTVQEAVAYCLSNGLHRTPKTVRKWASRAAPSPSGQAEVTVQRQDTENGFRWLIDRASLETKTAQEKSFEQRKAEDENPSEPVGTGAHGSAQVPSTIEPNSDGHTHEHQSRRVRTGSDAEDLVEFLKKLEHRDKQLDVKDRQIDALLERDHETNILIQGLQQSLKQVANALPSGERVTRHAPREDNSQAPEVRDAIQ